MASCGDSEPYSCPPWIWGSSHLQAGFNLSSILQFLCPQNTHCPGGRLGGQGFLPARMLESGQEGRDKGYGMEQISAQVRRSLNARRCPESKGAAPTGDESCVTLGKQPGGRTATSLQERGPETSPSGSFSTF